MGDRLFEKIKADVFKYLESISKYVWMEFADNGRLTQYEYFSVSYAVEKFEEKYKDEKILSIFDFTEEANQIVKTAREEDIPSYMYQYLEKPPVWCTTEKDDYFLLLERPGPIATLSCDYGGEFIPNRYHELGIDIYCWKFPNQLRAEEYFEQIERATNYIFLPASQPQLLLAGV